MKATVNLESLLSFFLLATLFVLPLSSTGKSICIAASLGLIFFIPAYRKEAITIMNQPWCKWGIALFAFSILACWWSPASLKEEILVIEKYSKLIYLPFLVAGFRKKSVRLGAIHAFLGAMVLISVIATLKYHGYLESIHVNPESIFRNHIITSFMMAFGAYLAAVLFVQRKEASAWVKFSYPLLVLLFTYYLFFINSGRTGYAMYFLLANLFTLQFYSWKRMIIGFFMTTIFFGAVYFTSNAMQQSVQSTSNELTAYEANHKDTSIGFRLQFHDFAKALFARHPLIGNGTGSFTYYFDVLNPVPAWGKGHVLLEPHSQYWLVASEFGLVGLGILFLFFLALLRALWSREGLKPVGLGLLIPFLLGNLSDSLLFYSGSGYLFLLFMAIVLADQLPFPASGRRVASFVYSTTTACEKKEFVLRFWKFGTNAP